MKKYFIYQDTKGTYFLAKTKTRKTLGKLVGEFKAGITTAQPSRNTPIEAGYVYSLIDGTFVHTESVEFY